MTEGPSRVPTALRDHVAQINQITDAFCLEHLDAGYAELCRRLTGKLARKRPSPLVRGDLRIWAAGVVYTVGVVNFLFDRSRAPYLSADELSRGLRVPKSTMSGKSKRIQNTLGLIRLDPEFCHPDLLEHNPLAWIVEVNGLPVDARWLPPEVQEQLREHGLIPTLPDSARNAAA